MAVEASEVAEAVEAGKSLLRTSVILVLECNNLKTRIILTES